MKADGFAEIWQFASVVLTMPYHRTRIEPFNTLHDLCLTLLATVLLPVDSGVSQLLHHLKHGPIIMNFSPCVHFPSQM